MLRPFFDGDKQYGIALLTEAGEIVHRYVLPERGHDSVFDPSGRRLVTFARRPGTFAAVIDTAKNAAPLVFHAPEDRHFYGHGRFSADGRLLYATENDFDNARGAIGVYDATDDFRRIGEFFSGGIGPHDMTVLPGGKTMLIANGGLETHPDYGRTVLNIATMKPNLALVDLATADISGGARTAAAYAQAVDPPSLHDGGRDGLVRRSEPRRHPRTLPLAGSMTPGGELASARHDRRGPAVDARLYRLRRRQRAAGSVVFTSPQGNVAFEVEQATGTVLARHDLADVCGAATKGRGFFLSTGKGMLDGRKTRLSWDNHIVRRPA
jgi:hypothetical protein